jgi:3-isopropylmalate dehydrogenase
VPEAIKVLRAAGADFEFEEFDVNADSYLRTGVAIPSDVWTELQAADSILFGAVGDPRVPDPNYLAGVLLRLRFELDLYVNLRPAKLYDDRLSPLRREDRRHVDLMIVRENTEGLYVGMGGRFKKGTADEIATQEDVNTRKGVERIIRYAFEFARRRGLRRVCMSDKSNALTYGHNLWTRVFAAVRREYSDIDSSHMYIDNLLLQMVRDPSQFQVIVTCNLFGDIASDLGAGLIGGLGLAPSGNIHPSQVSLFEPVHGSAPDIAGKGIANPMGAALAAAMMCESIGWPGESQRIEEAVRAAIREGKTSADLGGSLSTRELGDWLTNKLLAS